MIAREGYVSLATLWNEFERRFGIWCQDWATKCYEADLIDSPVWFGTALDLCEDLFIRSLDGSTLTLLGPDGSILEVPAALGTGRLRLLGKLGVLESAAIADNKMETGKNGRWLMQMGSSRFSAPDDKILPMSPKRSRWREEWAPLLTSKSFNTLPILFERGAYVIALELPPWAADLIEDSYVRNLWNNARGSSICTSNEQAETWRKTLRPQFTLELLKAVVPDAPVYDELQLADRGGRPRKLDRIVEVWRNLDLGNSTLSWKERRRLVSEKLGESVSVSSLRRADRLTRKPED